MICITNKCLNRCLLIYFHLSHLGFNPKATYFLVKKKVSNGVKHGTVVCQIEKIRLVLLPLHSVSKTPVIQILLRLQITKYMVTVSRLPRERCLNEMHLVISKI